MIEQPRRRRVVQPAADVQRPEVAEGDRLVAVVGQQSLQFRHDRRIPTLGQDSPGLGGEPVVGAGPQRDQLRGAALRQVERRDLATVAVDDAIDPAVGSVPGVARVEVCGAACRTSPRHKRRHPAPRAGRSAGTSGRGRRSESRRAGRRTSSRCARRRCQYTAFDSRFPPMKLPRNDGGKASPL